MPIIKLFLDFDNTQVNGNLHNAIIGTLKKNDYPKGYSDFWNVIETINTKKELPKEITDWLDQLIEKNNIRFFDAQLLENKIAEYVGIEIQAYTLTASGVPGAIQYMYNKEGLGGLMDAIIPVPLSNSANNKAEVIKETEDYGLLINKTMGDNEPIISIFADDSAKNISKVSDLPQTDGVFRIIIPIHKDGLNEKSFKDIDDSLTELGVLLKETQALEEPIYQNVTREITGAEASKTDAVVRKKQITPQETSRHGTVHDNTSEEIRNSEAAATRTGVVLRKEQKKPQEMQKILQKRKEMHQRESQINREKGGTLDEVKIEETPKSNEVIVHLGSTNSDLENLGEKIGKLRVKSVIHPDGILFRSRTSPMSGMTISKIELSAAAAKAREKKATASDKGKTSQRNAKGIKR